MKIDKRGRPRANRKPVERDLNVAELAARMPHRRAVRSPVRRTDAKAETHVGRMALNRELSDAQYQAAVMLRDIVRRYQAAINAPRPDRGMPPLDGARPGGREMSDRACQRAMRQFCDTMSTLRSGGVSLYATQLLCELVVYDQPPIPTALNLYRNCLNILGNTWGFSRARKCA